MGPKNWTEVLFNYWNDLVLGALKTYLEVSVYVSLKGATAGVWGCSFCWIWLEVSDLFKYKCRGVGPKNLAV